MRNNCLEKSSTKCDGKASPRHFYKKLTRSPDQQSEIL